MYSYISIAVFLILFLLSSITHTTQSIHRFYNSKHSSPLPAENEYALKAAFIYRFTEYIEWPGLENQTTFTIAILGNSPITGELKKIASQKKVNEMQIVIKEHFNLDDIGVCQILFVSKSSSIPLNSVLSQYGNDSTLIVSEQEGYGSNGTHLNFLLQGNHVNFEANVSAIKKTKLNVGSQLLKHAIIVG